jgi:hypothetical protein
MALSPGTMKTLRLLLLASLPVCLIHAQESALAPGRNSSFGTITAAAESDGRNLLVNSNFKEGTIGWELMNWGKDGRMRIDTNELHDGKPTLRVENAEPCHSFIRQVLQGKPHTRYRFSAYIKTKDVEVPNDAPKSGAILMVGRMAIYTPLLEGTKPWTKVSVEFATKDDPEIRLGPSLGTDPTFPTGTAWFSDVKLVELAAPLASASGNGEDFNKGYTRAGYPVNDLRAQLAGTSWKVVSGQPVRPGLVPLMSFNGKTVDPADYRYEANAHDSTVTIFFNHGDNQLLLLTDEGKRLRFNFGGRDYTYDLVSH